MEEDLSGGRFRHVTHGPGMCPYYQNGRGDPLQHLAYTRPPATSATMAAFLAKLPFLVGEPGEKVEAWGSARFKHFRVVDIQCPAAEDETPTCLAGGLFREPPRSLKHFQRLLNTNLTNWGVSRTGSGIRGLTPWSPTRGLLAPARSRRRPSRSPWTRIRR
jgi:hypothetical protein